MMSIATERFAHVALLSASSVLVACSPTPRNAAKSLPIADTPAAPGPPTDTPAEALGRRILSTAFVRVGPDNFLMIGLSDGRTLVLRDVVMRPKDYCGVQAEGGSAGSKYCGGYANVAAARPGGAPAVTPIAPAPGAAKRR